MFGIIPQKLMQQVVEMHLSKLLIATLLSLMLSGFIMQSASAQYGEPQIIDYTIQPGDTVIRIAEAYGTSIEVIADLNNMSDPGAIWAGQVIKVPYYPPVAAEPAPPAVQGAWQPGYSEIETQAAQLAESMPACPPELHDPTVWHGLVNQEFWCHYDHEHKDNPHTVSDIFGPVGTGTGQEISYPWQTVSHHGAENEHKHEGYGWLVRRDMPCIPNGTGGCITDFRAQFHAIMAPMGATTRFHSFWMEARACRTDNPTQCGILRTGGWLDYGVLLIDGQHIPLPGDPVGGPFPAEHRPARLHCVENSHTCGAAHGIWYSEQYNPWTNEPGSVLPQLALATDDAWGIVDPANPNAFEPFCPDAQCRYNNSVMEAHLLSFYLPLRLDVDGDGIVNFSGYTDRWGKLMDTCTAPGPDCIPLEISNLPLGHYQYRDDTHGFKPVDHDVSPEGEFWIKFPN